MRSTLTFTLQAGLFAMLACTCSALFAQTPIANPEKPFQRIPPIPDEYEEIKQPTVDPEELFQRISAAVVRMETKDDFGQLAASGSGFIIPVEAASRSADNSLVHDLSDFLVITNFHVIRGAVKASVRCQDGRQWDIIYVEREDESLDLAVLTVRKEDSRSKPFPHIDLRTAATLPAGSLPGSKLKVGSRVFAIGSPVGLTNSLSEGLVSGFRDRSAGSGWIQTTAPSSPGSSGGPLLNAAGEVVGITTARIEGGQNLNFAIPVSDLRSLLYRHGRSPRNVYEGRSIKETEDAAFISAQYLMSVQFQRESGSNPLQEDYDSRYWKHFEETARTSVPHLLALARVQYETEKYAGSLRTLEEAAELVNSPQKQKPAMTAEESKSVNYLIYYLMAKVRDEIETAAAKKRPLTYLPSRSGYFFTSDAFIETIAAAKKAKELNPDFAPTYHLLYGVYRWSGQLPEALVEAEFLVKMMPYCGRAYRNRAEVSELLERYDSAIADYTKAVDLNPSDAESLRNLGGVYSTTGQHGEAIATYNRALKLHSSCSLIWLTHFNLGIEYEKLNNLKRAIYEYELVLKDVKYDKDGSFGLDVQSRIADCRARLAASQEP